MFNFTDTKKASFELIPNNTDAVMAMTSAEFKDGKNPGSRYISAKYTIMSGDFEGRSIFGMFTTENSNEKAVAIGASQIKSLLMAVNAKSFNFPDEASLLDAILDKPFTGRIGIQKGKDGYEDKNNIKGFSEYKERTETKEEIPF